MYAHAMECEDATSRKRWLVEAAANGSEAAIMELASHEELIVS